MITQQRTASYVFTLIASIAFGAQAAEKVTLRLDFTPGGHHAAMHLAKDKGWFAKEGLDLDIQDGAGSLHTIQLVASDQADIGQVQLGGMAMAMDKKLPIKSFAGFMRRGDYGVLVPRDSGINTIADLKGKRLVTFSSSPWVPFIDSFLAKAGLDRKSVTILYVAPGAMLTLYTSKEADGVLTVAPYGLPLVEKSRPSKSIPMSDGGITFPSYGLIASHNTLERRKDMLRKVVKVQIDTWEYIMKGNGDEAVQAIVKQRSGMKLDPEALKGQLEQNLALFNTEATKGRRIGWQAREDWAAALKSMKEAGAISGNLKPEDHFTNAFIPDR